MLFALIFGFCFASVPAEYVKIARWSEGTVSACMGPPSGYLYFPASQAGTCTAYYQGQRRKQDWLQNGFEKPKLQSALATSVSIPPTVKFFKSTNCSGTPYRTTNPAASNHEYVCANENNLCTCRGVVRFGDQKDFTEKLGVDTDKTGTLRCIKETFGGVVPTQGRRRCYCRPVINCFKFDSDWTEAVGEVANLPVGPLEYYHASKDTANKACDPSTSDSIPFVRPINQCLEGAGFPTARSVIIRSCDNGAKQLTYETFKDTRCKDKTNGQNSMTSSWWAAASRLGKEVGMAFGANSSWTCKVTVDQSISDGRNQMETTNPAYNFTKTRNNFCYTYVAPPSTRPAQPVGDEADANAAACLPAASFISFAVALAACLLA